MCTACTTISPSLRRPVHARACRRVQVVPLAKALGVHLDSDIYFGDTEEFASHIQEVQCITSCIS